MIHLFLPICKCNFRQLNLFFICKQSSFFLRSNPTPEKVPIDFRPIDNLDNVNYAIVKNDGMEMSTQPRQQSIQFWNEFFQKHGTEFGVHYH